MVPAPPSVGIIYPPPEVRNIVDKTAGFVARNGLQFEQRIKQNEAENPKFNFLNVNDPYHAYYAHKVNEIREEVKNGGAGAASATALTKNKGGSADQQGGGAGAKKGVEKDKEVSVDPKKAALEAMRQRQADILKLAQRGMDNLTMDDDDPPPTEPPPPFEFTSDPPSISGYDLDVVKLTAQFVARNGRQFLTRLMNREERNYQFDFLRPQHALFQYFTSLLEQYTKILVPDKDIVERLESETDISILQDVDKRVRWIRYEVKEKRRQQEATELERLSYAQIDWHSFVVVETVDYQPNESGVNLPLPTKPEEVGSRVLIQRRIERQKADALNKKVRSSGEKGDFIDDIDIDDEEEDREIGAVNMQVEDMDEDEESESSEGEDDDTSEGKVSSGDRKKKSSRVPPTVAPLAPGHVEVRKYDPKKDDVPSSAGSSISSGVGGSKANPGTTDLISPITGQRIPADQVQQHMRIGLLDPRWVEERDKQVGLKSTQEDVYASGDQITASLKHLAKRRTDIFGVDEGEAVKETAIGKTFHGEDDGMVAPGSGHGADGPNFMGNSEKEDFSSAIVYIDPNKTVPADAVRSSDKVVKWDGHRGSANKAMQAAASQVTKEEKRERKRLEDENEAKLSAIGPKHDVVGITAPQPVAPPPPPSMMRPPTAALPLAPPGFVGGPPGQFLPPPPPPQHASSIQSSLMMMAAPGVPGGHPPAPMMGMPTAFMPGAPGPLPPQPRQPFPVGGEFTGVSDPKRAKTMGVGGATNNEESLLMEEEMFTKQMGGSDTLVTFQIICPNMSDISDGAASSWKPMFGQSIPIHMKISGLVSDIKSELFNQLEMPTSKQKLQLAHTGLFLKDSMTLAHYNIRQGTIVHLVVKERGGRKK